jgi:hypothetical protein
LADPSPSVSVSVSSPSGFERAAGLAERLNSRTVASPPSSCDGKCTFLGCTEGVWGEPCTGLWVGEEGGEGRWGVVGADAALK